MIENFIESSKYAQNLVSIESEMLKDIERESLEEKVPIVTREVLKFMIFTAEGIKAQNILEIGTAVGYSGAFLAQIANRNKGQLTTIEIDDERYKRAVKNFEKMDLLNKNKLILGDALEEIPKLNKNEKFDFIFIDASKGQYMKFFQMCWELLNEKGIIFIDNLMFRGLVAENDGNTPKKYRTIVERLKEFINKLNREHDFVLLPFGDGVGLVRKRLK